MSVTSRAQLRLDGEPRCWLCRYRHNQHQFFSPVRLVRPPRARPARHDRPDGGHRQLGVRAAERTLVTKASTGSRGMNVSLDEHRLGGLRWIVVRGPDQDGFRALGKHARDDIKALIGTWRLLPRHREHVSNPPGSDRLAAVRQASALRFPEVWTELAALAEGAAVPLDDLALLNFRGDLGDVLGGIGCSDLAWRRDRSVIAHNEDGAPENVGQCAMLTLALDSLPTVTAIWYPSFLPSNAFALTGDGLVWAIDHLPVISPGGGRAARSWAGACSERREP